MKERNVAALRKECSAPPFHPLLEQIRMGNFAEVQGHRTLVWRDIVCIPENKGLHLIHILRSTSHIEAGEKKMELFEVRTRVLYCESQSLRNLIIKESCSPTDWLRLRSCRRQVRQQPGHWWGRSPEQLGQLPLHTQRQPGRPWQGWQGWRLRPWWWQWWHSWWQRQL